jgi:hypothetical protein
MLPGGGEIYHEVSMNEGKKVRRIYIFLASRPGGKGPSPERTHIRRIIVHIITYDNTVCFSMRGGLVCAKLIERQVNHGGLP